MDSTVDQSVNMIASKTASKPEISTWLTEHVARYCEKDESAIDPTVSLADYGMDSYYAVTLTGDIEEKFGIIVDPEMIWENPTIDLLGAAIAKQIGDQN